VNVHINSASSPKGKVKAVRRPCFFADRQVVEAADVKTGAATAQDTTGKRPDTDPAPAS
jgi:hypothetical protein